MRVGAYGSVAKSGCMSDTVGRCDLIASTTNKTGFDNRMHVRLTSIRRLRWYTSCTWFTAVMSTAARRTARLWLSRCAIVCGACFFVSRISRCACAFILHICTDSVAACSITCMVYGSSGTPAHGMLKHESKAHSVMCTHAAFLHHATSQARLPMVPCQLPAYGS